MSAALAQSLEEGRDELTSEEMEQFADEQARAHLGISIYEFRRRAAEETLPDDPNVVHIALLAGVELHTCRVSSWSMASAEVGQRVGCPPRGR